MNYLFSFFILIAIFSSNTAFSACENVLNNFTVSFPTGHGNVRSYGLNNGYVNMVITMKYRNMNNSRMRALYNTLDEAGYTNGTVSFGVSPAICGRLSEYQLPVGFGGSYAHVPLKDVQSVTRVR